MFYHKMSNFLKIFREVIRILDNKNFLMYTLFREKEIVIDL